MSGPFCFAWAGGAIEAQVTLVINGTTHGGRPVITTIVGDTGDPVSPQQLINLASTQGLQAGALYRLGGPGVTAGTYFLFDQSVLSGQPDSINLSAAVGAQHSAQFNAEQAGPVGTVLATMTHGSSSITLDVTGLAAGTYGIAGTGIGETDVPVATTDGTSYTTGGGIVLVDSAILSYGGSGSGTLSILAATPHNHHTTDSFGQPATVTNYSVGSQGVRATASGTFPVLLTGFPATDPFALDGIPTGALSALTPGLVYNIVGNGLEVGTTFTAPSGGTSVVLDLPASSSEINGIYTITGPRTPNAPFDASAHNRFDEDIVNVEIAQEEGGLATLNVQLKNPNVGLLATGRNLWCWLSWDQNWPAGSPSLLPLFNGRLIGVPRLQGGEVVELQFLARPDDFNSQKLALADSLATLPYYDPVWAANPTIINPDNVLETYSALYHVDRTSLAVTVSDILDGDSIIDIGEDVSIYDKFSLEYGEPPLVATSVSGTVSWQQQAEGVIDITQNIVSAFAATGSAYTRAFPTDYWGNIPSNLFNTGYIPSGGGGLISCLCGDGLKSDWPKPGTNIGGGWSLSTRNDPNGTPLCYILDATIGNQGGGWIQPGIYQVSYSGQSPWPSQAGNTTEQSNVNVFLQPFGAFTVGFPLNVYKVRMALEYRADRRRSETVTAVVAAGVQRELSDSSESDRDTISLSSDSVGLAVDLNGTMPIGNVAYRSYFQTARGAASFEYLLLAARAKLRARARSVDVTFAVPWASALSITLRHNVRYTDRRLPGGVALGKVKSYKLMAGTAGMLGEFVIGCAIGTDETTTPSTGVPVYVADGYVDGYQARDGAQYTIAENTDLYYESLDKYAIADDGLNLANITADQAINECIVTNGLSVQLPALDPFQQQVVPLYGDPVGTMRTLTTTVTLDLKPVQGSEFHTTFTPAVSQLQLPKMINLEAPHA